MRTNFFPAPGRLAHRASVVALIATAAALGGALGGCGSDDAGGGAAPGPTGGGGTGGEGGTLFGETTSSSTSSGTGGGGSVSCDPGATEGPHTWSVNAGDGAAQLATAVALDPSGAVVMAGAFAGALTLGGTTLTSLGANDIFVAKLSAAGAPVWALRFGDSADQSARAVASDAQGNVLVTGRFLGSVNFGGGVFTKPGCCFNQAFLAKLGPDGAHLWSKSLGNVNDETGRGVAVDAAGNVALVGEYQTSIDFGGGVTVTNAGGGTDDAFVALFNAQGVPQWARSFGDTMDQSAHAVAFDEAGNLLVTGEAAGSIDLGAGPLPVTGLKSAFVLKMSPAGAPIWGKLFGANEAFGEGIAADGQGNVVVAGDHKGEISFGGGTFTTQLDVNAFVVKLDPQGEHLWSKSFGDNQAQHARGVGADGAGRVVVAGDFGGSMDVGGATLTSAGANDAFLVKLDTVGCDVWAKAFGDGASQVANAVSVASNGAAAVAGRMAGTADFGGGVKTAAGDDVFVAKLAP